MIQLPFPFLEESLDALLLSPVPILGDIFKKEEEVPEFVHEYLDLDDYVGRLCYWADRKDDISWEVALSKDGKALANGRATSRSDAKSAAKKAASKLANG